MSRNNDTAATIAAILCSMGENARPSCARHCIASSRSTYENCCDGCFSRKMSRTFLGRQDDAAILESCTSTAGDLSSSSTSSGDEDVPSLCSHRKQISVMKPPSGESKQDKVENDFSSGISTVSTITTVEDSWVNDNESSVSSKQSYLGDETKHSQGSKSKKACRASLKAPPGTSYENRKLRPAPYFYYIDRSREPDYDPFSPLSPPHCVPNFAIKLHAILVRKDLEDIVAWMPHGRSWKIIDQVQFEKKVLPDYFKHSNIASFYRQANGWGFRRMLKGPDKGSFCSENFLRGVPHLCKKMRRIGGAKTIENANINHEPNLWKISAENPLPDEIPRDDLNFIVLKTINENVKKYGPNAKMPFVHDVKKTARNEDWKPPSATTSGNDTSGTSREASAHMEHASYGGAGTGYSCPPRAPSNSSHDISSEKMQHHNYPSEIASSLLQQIQHQTSTSHAQAQPQTYNALQFLSLMNESGQGNNQAAYSKKNETTTHSYGIVEKLCSDTLSRQGMKIGSSFSTTHASGSIDLNGLAAVARQVLLQSNNAAYIDPSNPNKNYVEDAMKTLLGSMNQRQQRQSKDWISRLHGHSESTTINDEVLHQFHSSCSHFRLSPRHQVSQNLCNFTAQRGDWKNLGQGRSPESLEELVAQAIKTGIKIGAAQSSQMQQPQQQLQPHQLQYIQMQQQQLFEHQQLNQFNQLQQQNLKNTGHWTN